MKVRGKPCELKLTRMRSTCSFSVLWPLPFHTYEHDMSSAARERPDDNAHLCVAVHDGTASLHIWSGTHRSAAGRLCHIWKLFVSAWPLAHRGAEHTEVGFGAGCMACHSPGCGAGVGAVVAGVLGDLAQHAGARDSQHSQLYAEAILANAIPQSGHRVFVKDGSSIGGATGDVPRWIWLWAGAFQLCGNIWVAVLVQGAKYDIPCVLPCLGVTGQGFQHAGFQRLQVAVRTCSKAVPP